MARKKRAHDTKYSYAVSHPSTNSAQSSLTVVIGREPVFSRRYGREHVCLKRIYFSMNSIFRRRIGQWHGKKEPTTRSIPKRSPIQVLAPLSLVQLR